MAGELQTYRLHGLSIRTTHRLSAPVTDGEADLVVVDLPERTPTYAVPAGSVIAHAKDFYVATEHADGHLLRYFGWSDFHLDSSLTTVRCEPHRGGPPGYTEVLLEASVIAWILALRGHVGLHASAVRLHGRTHAIGGPANAGKTSIATLACGAGGLVISDDLLRVSTDAPIQCFRGSSELRIRESVRHLADLPGLRVRRTADERLAAKARAISEDRTDLHAIVLPEVGQSTNVQRLAPPDAVVPLVGLARLLWVGSQAQGHHLAAMAKLARSVPVFRVVAPWQTLIARSDTDALRDLLAAL